MATPVEQRAMIIVGLVQDPYELAVQMAIHELRIEELTRLSADKDASIAQLIEQLQKAEAQNADLGQKYADHLVSHYRTETQRTINPEDGMSVNGPSATSDEARSVIRRKALQRGEEPPV